MIPLLIQMQAKVLITSSPILGPDRKNKNDNLSNSGYAHEQAEILNFIKKQKNLFIVNGDRHWQYVTHVKKTNLWEFGCGAGADVHAGGWKKEDFRPEHQFLRVKGGFLSVSINSGSHQVSDLRIMTWRAIRSMRSVSNFRLSNFVLLYDYICNFLW